MSSKLLLAIAPAACLNDPIIGSDGFGSGEKDGQDTTDGWDPEFRKLPPDPIKLTDSDIAVRMDEKKETGENLAGQGRDDAS